MVFSGSGKLLGAGEEGQSSTTDNRPKYETENFYEGLFLRATLGGIFVHCLLDTGSSVSVVHPALFDRMTGGKPSFSSTEVKRRMTDGGLVPANGKGSFSVCIQDVCYKQTMVVAEIETPVVLGYDFMCQHKCQINVAKGEVLLHGNLVQCVYESTLPSIFRIQVAERIVVSMDTEMIVPAKVEGCTPHIMKGLIEAEVQTHKTGLLVAKTVIDPCHRLVSLRVLNVSGKEKVLYANMHIATCHPITDIKTVTIEVSVK